MRPTRTPPKTGGVVYDAPRAAAAAREAAKTLPSPAASARARSPLSASSSPAASFFSPEIALAAQSESTELHRRLFSCSDPELIPILAIEASCAPRDALLDCSSLGTADVAKQQVLIGS